MTIVGWLTNSFRSTYNHNSGHNVCSYIFIQSREYAARKGTREKAKKKKIKKVIEKVGFIIPKKRELLQKKTASPLSYIHDNWKTVACDDVWIQKYHQRQVYSFEKAIEYHCEAVHPTMLNKPNAPISVSIALNLKLPKKNRCLEKFWGIVDIPHVFDSGETPSKVLALCKNAEFQESARNAGADFAGGIPIIKQIQNGGFGYKEYDYIVAHADILAELLLIRGLLKKKFPNVKTGTLGPDIGKLVSKHKQGMKYVVIPDIKYKDYGQTDVTFGLLDMDVKQLKANFSAIINEIEAKKPIPNGSFIQRIQIRCPTTREILKIDFKEFISIQDAEGVEDEAEDNTAIISTH